MNRRRPLLALALLAGLGLGAFALLSPESAAEPAERWAVGRAGLRGWGGRLGGAHR